MQYFHPVECFDICTPGEFIPELLHPQAQDNREDLGRGYDMFQVGTSHENGHEFTMALIVIGVQGSEPKEATSFFLQNFHINHEIWVPFYFII